MQANDNQPNENLANHHEESDEEEEDSPLLQSCRGIIEDLNFGQVEYLCKLVGVQFWCDCNEADFERSKLPCIKYELAERFSSKGDGGDDILRSVLNYDDDGDDKNVFALLHDAELLDLDEYSIEYVQSLNSQDNVEDNISSSKKEVGYWSDESDHDDDKLMESNESGEVDNVDNPGEQFGDDISGDINVHPRKEVVTSRNISPNDVANTLEFDNHIYEQTKEGQSTAPSSLEGVGDNVMDVGKCLFVYVIDCLCLLSYH